MSLEWSAVLACVGAAGSILMFIADLVLYLPHNRVEWSSSIYFAQIDPGGNCLLESPMRMLSEDRMVLGGVGTVVFHAQP